MKPPFISIHPSRVFNGALIALFLTLIWLPTMDGLWHWDHCPSQNENRKLANFPEYESLTKTGAYLAALENYFDDHFGFRNQLMLWNNHWKFKIFNESPLGLAMVGRNGWLYWAGDGMLANYTGDARFTQNELNGWKKLLEARRDWLAARGGKYIFVIAPDKHTIYPENLPQWVVKSETPSKLDQLLAFMRDHSSVVLLDLRPALMAGKNDGTTFLQTDTHWNNYGAFLGYQQLVLSLQKSMPAIAPLALNAFDRKRIVGRGGDLAVCLEQQDQIQETQEVAFAPRPPLVRLKQIHAKFMAQYAAIDEIVTENPDAVGKAILYRDSFAEKWIPFLGYHFRETAYIRQTQWNKQWLEREKPDVVIDEMVERLCINQNPFQLLSSDQ